MKFLITGGCGFLGSNLSSEVLKRGNQLKIIDNLSRQGSEKNLEWLRSQGDFEFFEKDIKDFNSLYRIISDYRPDAVFHVAGQVAMTTSLENPRLDFETNVLGTFNLLQALKEKSPETVLIYSSTNKVYGDLEDLDYLETETRYQLKDFPDGLCEETPLNFRTPYGCSKGAADQYCLDFHKNWGLPTVVFRHSSICVGRQFSSFDQGWMGWFVQKAIEQKQGHENFTIAGNGKQVRDVLFSEDIVALYFSAWEQNDLVAGEAFNIGGGYNNSLSLLELFSILEKEVSVELNFDKLPPRSSDQKVFVADTKKINKALSWAPKIDKHQGIKKMIEWTQEAKRAL